VQLHQPAIQQRFEALGASLLVVSFSEQQVLADWVSFFRAAFLERSYRERSIDLPKSILDRTIFLSNPDLSAYHAYGLGTMRVSRAFRLKNLWQYARWSTQRKVITKWYGNPFQRGGDFVIGAKGLITLAHSGADQSDRPAAEEIVKALGHNRLQ